MIMLSMMMMVRMVMIYIYYDEDSVFLSVTKMMLMGRMFDLIRNFTLGVTVGHS